MKALILYRSHYGNTKEVAEVMAGEVKRLGHEALIQDLRLRLPELTDVDLVMIGAPTRMARVTWKAYRALRRLRRKDFGNKPVAVFDTYGPEPADPVKREEDRKWIHPGAAGRLLDKAAELGLNVRAECLRCEVEGMKGPLKKGEKEKAIAFARKLMPGKQKEQKIPKVKGKSKKEKVRKKGRQGITKKGKGQYIKARALKKKARPVRIIKKKR